MTSFGLLGRISFAVAAFALIAAFNPALAIQPTLEKITQEADGTDRVRQPAIQVCEKWTLTKIP
jgi:hypothetical protein